MNGKPVFSVPATTVLNLKSGFAHKLLCDGPTFSTGTACAYSCSFCYVPDMMRKLRPHLEKHGVTGPHEDIVIRRENALDILRGQLTRRNGAPIFDDPADNRVVYSSPSVDVAANLDLVRETVEACKLILDLTHWQIRLLSKSNLLPKIASAIPEKHAQRMIYGVSTGTLDDGLASAFESGTPRVSKRIESLHWLQDRGFRTYGMICPSLPLPGNRYEDFAQDLHRAIRSDRCEHVWAEVINVRGESMTRTLAALRAGGYREHADVFAWTFAERSRWEAYARATFEAHAHACAGAPGKLRFLQYVTAGSRDWWREREKDGAILL